MDPIIVQTSAFVVMFAAGMTLGFMFDLYRLFRGAVHPRGILDGLFDLLFWCVSAPIMILFIFYGNWGDLRAYVFVGLVLGAAFYFRVLGESLRRLVGRLFKLLARVGRLAVRGAQKALIDPSLWLWDYGATVADRLSERAARRKAAGAEDRNGKEGEAPKPVRAGVRRRRRPETGDRERSS